MLGEISKIDYLELLKAQYNELQAEYIELEKSYKLLTAATSSSEVSESFPAKLLKITKSLEGSEKFSDIRFVIGEKRIPSHRFVIEARTNIWNEIIENSEKQEIVLDDRIDFESFQNVYKWIYTDFIDLKILEDSELLRVCNIACLLKLENLQKICIDQLSLRLDVDNCVTIYEFSEKHNLKMLGQVCGSMIATSWEQFTGKEFNQMSAPVLYRLIDKNTKNVLHSIIDIGREDVLFLYFMQNSSKIPKMLNEIDENGSTGIEKALLLQTEKGAIIAEQLAEKGADLNSLDQNGETILMRMIRKGKLKACDFLIKYGANTKFKHSIEEYNLVHILSSMKNDEIGEIVKWLIANKDKFEVDEMNKEKRTALMLSVLNENEQMCKGLIEAGANVNKKGKNEETALSLCLNLKLVNKNILKILIDSGANINCYIDKDPILNKIVERDDLESLEILLAAGAETQLKNSNGQNSFHIAAKCSNAEILSILTKSQTKIDWSPDCFDKTPLDLAVEAKNLKCARLLIKAGANINRKDLNGHSLLSKSIMEADDEMSVFLIDHGATATNNDLIGKKEYLEYCCEKGLLNTIRALLSNGLNINQRSSTGYTLIETSLINKNYDISSLLVSFGCDIESRVRISTKNDTIKIINNDEGDWDFEQTLLHAFIDVGNQEAAVFLIENGADLNAKKVYRNEIEDDKSSPAHMAILWAQNEVLKKLVQKGADLKSQDSDGRTACHIGVREKNAEGVRILLSSENVDFIGVRDRFGQTILSQAMINKDHKIASLIVERQSHAAVQTNGNGENLLHSAIRQNDLESVLFLLAVAKADACRPVQDGSNKSPLHLAAAAKNEMILRNLILANDQINMCSSDGCSPLHDAIKHRNHIHASILIENGADINLKDEYGENALHCAVRSGSIECIRLLLSNPNCHRFEQNNLGYTTLHICSMLTVDRLPKRTTSAEICELLLGREEHENEKQTASFIDLKDHEGNSALMIAYSQGNALVCRCLLKRKAKFEIMVFNRVVQIGRVVFIANGNDNGKLATIVNVIDGNRVLVDGPSSGVVRSVRNLKDLKLTKFTTKINVGQRTKGVQAAFDEAKVAEGFQKTQWAQKIAKKALRAKLTDFQRYKLQRAKQLRNRIVRIELAKLKKAQK